MNIFPKYPFLEETTEGDPGAILDGGIEGEAPPEPTPFLRDIDEDSAYEALRAARNTPDLLRALESRVTEQLPPMASRLEAMEKSLGQRVAFNPELKRSLEALNSYDPSGELGKQFIPALLEDLKEAMQINQLDQTSVDPFIQPQLQQYNDFVWEQMVSTMIGDSVAEAIPDSVEGKFDPKNTRQKDFVEWYAQQDAPTQRAFHSFSPAYIRAFKKFESWESTRVKERENAAGAASGRVSASTSITARGRTSGAPKLETEEDGFLSVFKQG